jgi:hypothetical protein
VLLLLTSSIASSSNHFLGICGHLSSMNQLNILKTLIVNSRVLSDASTFLSSPSFYISFGVLVLVNCWMSSLGELVFFFDYHLCYHHFYFFLNKIKYLITSRRTKNTFQSPPFRKNFCLNNYFFCFLTILPFPFT